MNFIRTEELEIISKAKNLLYNELFKPLGFPEDMQEKLKAPGKEHYFVCIYEKEINGVMVLAVDKERAELHHAATVNKYRNHGIGKKIWQEVYEFVKNEGIKTVELYSRNTAVDFWRSLGFIEVSEEWLETDLFMKHNIRHKKMEISID